MPPCESSSPPPPVRSLRSRFEQIAATASPPSSGLGSLPLLKRASSNSDLKRRQQFLDPKRIVSGPPDARGGPFLRTSPSSPDLKGPGNSKLAPPPPSRSRTPSPSLPPPLPRPTHSHSLSTASEPSTSVSTRTNSPSLSRRPPPPPPVKSGGATPTDTKAEHEAPAGGVASLRSKLTDAPESVGNGHAAFARNYTSRSVSASQPPALPARPGNSMSSTIKIPRASLPSLTTDVSPTHAPRIHFSPSDETHTLADSAYLLSRSPPPVPSRSTADLTAKVVDTDMHRPAEPVPIDQLRSSESVGCGSPRSEHGKRRVPPRPPVAATTSPPPLPPRRNASDEPEDPPPLLLPPPPLPPPLPTRRRSTDPHAPNPTPKLPPRIGGITPPPPRTIGQNDKLPPPRRRSDSDAESRLIDPPAPKLSSRIDGIPPPPTRAIGLNDKLPPPRRRSDSEAEAESSSDATPAGVNRTLEDLPDATHCSRRPPVLQDHKFARARIPVAVPAGVVAVAGPHVVVAGHHDIRVYDLAVGDTPVFVVELRDLGLEWRVKEPRVTAMAFRGGEGTERGRFVWCGSRDGHIWELDVVRWNVVRVRHAAHGHAVVQVIRHGRAMVTLDESGKALVWRDWRDLSTSQPRIARVTEKQGFVRMMCGLLWASSGPGPGHAGAGNARGPAVRVYDILAPNCTVKIVTPPEALGAVTSGTILPAQPGVVYLGHEGGYVSCWTCESPDVVDVFDSGRPVPVCFGVMKISVSDVLALEGVVDRLWVGSRSGVVAAYDVATRPWTMTNAWPTHGELPVLKLHVDPFSIEKNEGLHVVSHGRDELIHFWDGLLGEDWLDGEVQKREAEFSTFRDINVLICSWNIDAQKPDALTGNTENVGFLENVLHSVDAPDIIVFGFQELIDLENRSLTAKTVLLGHKKKTDGSISEKVSRSYRMWHERLVQAVRIAMPIEDPYFVAHTDSLVGLFSCIFVRQRQKHLLRDSAMATVKRGMGGRYGNKGAIVARFVVDDSSLCFINCHLAAGQSHTRARNKDVAAILEDGAALPRSDIAEALPYVGGGDGTMILDHELCFLGGDLNYRIDQRRDAVIAAVHSGDLDFLLHHDQLRKQVKNNPGFRLRSFTEAPISFAPTYKYDRRSNEYDSSEKKRAPAWCDRILYRCRDASRVHALHYRRYEANVSDHRPISAAFRVTVKSIRHDARTVVKAEVLTLWKQREIRLLFDMQEFYATQQIF